MRPDTACNLRSVKKNKQKNVVKQPFRNDSSLGYSSLKFVSNDTEIEIRHLEEGLQPVFKENPREYLLVSRL